MALDTQKEMIVFLIDLHVHTMSSAHAYSSVYENIMIAKQKKLKLIAITDHGPKLDDSPHR
ncbi:PHP domain-containing protein [Gilliamella sp. Pra-s60]|uniref:PHP domain-containing protein n=2 Tax=unclassified Gilliamella TaxID=2685620 RepID=UPI00351B6ECE